MEAVGLGSGGRLLTLGPAKSRGRDAQARRVAERDAQTRVSPLPPASHFRVTDLEKPQREVARQSDWRC